MAREGLASLRNLR